MRDVGQQGMQPVKHVHALYRLNLILGKRQFARAGLIVSPIGAAYFNSGLAIADCGLFRMRLLTSSPTGLKSRMVLDCGSPLPLWKRDVPAKAPEGRRTQRRYRAIPTHPFILRAGSCGRQPTFERLAGTLGPPNSRGNERTHVRC